MIAQFQGGHRWLSNFWPCTIVSKGGIEFPTVEHAYQWAKFSDPEAWGDPDSWVLIQDRIRKAGTPGETKRIAREPGYERYIRRDWETYKLPLMRALLAQKFGRERNKHLVGLLLETGDQPLVEGNTWHDNFWGKCSCKKCESKEGLNWLGFLLMERRAQLKETSA